MANLTPKTSHLVKSQWKSGVSGNPSGKPRGTKHLSTWIQEMLADDGFKLTFNDGSRFKGAPIRAIVATLIVRALEGDLKAIDLLAKYGYGTKLDLTTDYGPLPSPIYAGKSSEGLTDKPSEI